MNQTIQKTGNDFEVLKSFDQKEISALAKTAREIKANAKDKS